MKLQATIVISYRADSFGDAGDALDDVLRRARERDDVEIDSIQVGTPASAGPVSLPYVERPPAPPQRVPHPLPNGAARARLSAWAWRRRRPRARGCRRRRPRRSSAVSAPRALGGVGAPAGAVLVETRHAAFSSMSNLVGTRGPPSPAGLAASCSSGRGSRGRRSAKARTIPAAMATAPARNATW